MSTVVLVVVLVLVLPLDGDIYRISGLLYCVTFYNSTNFGHLEGAVGSILTKHLGRSPSKFMVIQLNAQTVI